MKDSGVDSNAWFFETIQLTEDNVHLAGYIYEEGDELGAVYKMFDENASYEGHIKGEVFQIVHAEG